MNIFLEFFDDPSKLLASKIGPLTLQYPMHYHPTLELIYCRSGTFTLHADSASRTMTEGSFALIFPLAVHSFSCEGQCECTIIHVPEDLFLQIARQFSLSNRQTGYVFPLFPHTQLLEAVYTYTVAADQTIASYYAMILLTLCLRQMQKTTAQATAFESSNYPLMRDILSYIQNHYKEALSLDTLCRTFSIGKSTLSRLINASLQSSLPELINKYRMLEAGYLLTHTQQPISQIAGGLGYASASNFTRNFRKCFGVSPREYRNAKG